MSGELDLIERELIESMISFAKRRLGNKSCLSVQVDEEGGVKVIVSSPPITLATDLVDSVGEMIKQFHRIRLGGEEAFVAMVSEKVPGVDPRKVIQDAVQAAVQKAREDAVDKDVVLTDEQNESVSNVANAFSGVLRTHGDFIPGVIQETMVRGLREFLEQVIFKNSIVDDCDCSTCKKRRGETV